MAAGPAAAGAPALRSGCFGMSTCQSPGAWLSTAPLRFVDRSRHRGHPHPFRASDTVMDNRCYPSGAAGRRSRRKGDAIAQPVRRLAVGRDSATEQVQNEMANTFLWSVSPGHAAVSLGARWRYMAMSDAFSAAQPDRLGGSLCAMLGGAQ